MTHRLFFPIGVVLFAIASLAAIPAVAQTTSNGPYYATPAWDQILRCDTQATCPRFIVLLNWTRTEPGPLPTLIIGVAVLDRETGLVWEQSPSTVTFSWFDARLHCNQLTVGNRLGWRLPTIQELASLIDPTVPSPGPVLSAGHPFSNVQTSSYYWSATTVAYINPSTSAWAVNFDNGFVNDGGDK